MKEGERFVRWGVNVFKILAWFTLIIEVGWGIAVLVMGGEPIPIFTWLDVPARVIGVVTCLLGGLYFFLCYLIASVIRLLLDLREQVNRLSTAGAARS